MRFYHTSSVQTALLGGLPRSLRPVPAVLLLGAGKQFRRRCVSASAERGVGRTGGGEGRLGAQRWGLERAPDWVGPRASPLRVRPPPCAPQLILRGPPYGGEPRAGVFLLTRLCSWLDWRPPGVPRVVGCSAHRVRGSAGLGEGVWTVLTVRSLCSERALW